LFWNAARRFTSGVLVRGYLPQPGQFKRMGDAAARAVAAQNCGINCAQIATVPMNSVIDASAAASSMKILNIARLPRTQAPAFQISVSPYRSGRKLRLSKNRLWFS
jgi:hypothetical protein